MSKKKAKPAEVIQLPRMHSSDEGLLFSTRPMSHSRALMRVQDDEARSYYEQEANECGWMQAQLERQITPTFAGMKLPLGPLD
jgi:hypothetical protein